MSDPFSKLEVPVAWCSVFTLCAMHSLKAAAPPVVYFEGKVIRHAPGPLITSLDFIAPIREPGGGGIFCTVYTYACKTGQNIRIIHAFNFPHAFVREINVLLQNMVKYSVQWILKYLKI